MSRKPWRIRVHHPPVARDDSDDARHRSLVDVPTKRTDAQGMLEYVLCACAQTRSSDLGRGRRTLRSAASHVGRHVPGDGLAWLVTAGGAGDDRAVEMPTELGEVRLDSSDRLAEATGHGFTRSLDYVRAETAVSSDVV